MEGALPFVTGRFDPRSSFDQEPRDVCMPMGCRAMERSFLVLVEGVDDRWIRIDETANAHERTTPRLGMHVVTAQDARQPAHHTAHCLPVFIAVPVLHENAVPKPG